MHLKRKTAWSNASLVGCRINCLIDFKEWHEGFVLQYHKSGKHFVEFRMANERRWLFMKKVAFYIVERPNSQTSDNNGEYKDSIDNEGLAPIEVGISAIISLKTEEVVNVIFYMVNVLGFVGLLRRYLFGVRLRTVSALQDLWQYIAGNWTFDPRSCLHHRD